MAARFNATVERIARAWLASAEVEATPEMVSHTEGLVLYLGAVALGMPLGQGAFVALVALGVL